MTGHLVRRFMLRAAGLWLAVRAVLAVSGAALGEGVPVSVEPSTAVAVGSLVTVLFLVDLHRRSERVFLANLGVSRRAAGLVCAGVTAVLELAASGIGALTPGLLA